MLFSEKSLQILWQNLSDPDVMKTHRNLCNRFLLTFALTVGSVGESVLRAQSESSPSRTEETQPVAPLRLIAQSEGRPKPPGDVKTLTAAAELKRSRDQMLRHASIRARIVEQVTLADRSYRAEGRYLQLALKPGDWHNDLNGTTRQSMALG